MVHSTQEQLCFPPVEGLTVRGHFDGGALSSDFGPLLLRSIDRQVGLTERLAQAFKDRRHPSYITHSVRALFAQRVYPVACAYEDGNDALKKHIPDSRSFGCFYAASATGMSWKPSCWAFLVSVMTAR